MEIIEKQYKLFNDNNKYLNYVQENNIMVYDKFDDTCIIETIDYKNIEFKYNKNNYRIPYFNNNKIFAIKIKLEEIYNYISSNSLIPNNEIICGETIQLLADVVTGLPNSLNYNPNNKQYSKNLTSIDSLDITKYNIIFVFTHDLQFFYNKFNSNKLNNKIIISHNSDCEISLKNNNVKLHMAQNCLINNNSLIPIPIGIENRQWFNHALFHKVRNMNINKTKNFYFYFNLNTYNSRIDCFNKLKNKISWNTHKNKEEYFIELASHKYSICPRGNGLDTHRIWESLYLNVIPIVIESEFINIHNLPIIILKDWSELDINNQEISFINQENSKLTVEYYKLTVEYYKNILNQ
jgi:hypothetical protein